MDTAKLFANGQSQAIRLPKAYRMPGKVAYIRKVGNAVLLLPEDNPWQILFDSLENFPDDFLAERQQGQTETRDAVLP